MMNPAKIFLHAMVLLFLACGCQWHRSEVQQKDYRTVPVTPRQDTDAARQHNAEAVRLLEYGDLAEGEKELKASLAADVFFGPAHNNLGTIYYRHKKFYLAAWEFQYAAKLMPYKAEPRSNLGLVFEAVGKLDEAAKAYEEALKLQPDAAVITGNLARVYVQSDRKDKRIRQLLSEIVLKDTRPDWVAWARQRLAIMGAANDLDTNPAEEE